MPVTFDDYVRARLGALLRIATAIAGDPHLAEEIVQDVLLKVARKWDDIGGKDHRDAYVRRMLVNEFVSWRRKWARLVPTSRIDLDAYAPDPSVRSADRDLLDRELQQLPERQRVVLVLRYLEGLSDVDIAAALGCAESSVRSIASRGLATLRVQMATVALTPLTTTPGGRR
jgi:RNA polymerase sigma-70 factor (sigma-E family)